MRLIAWEDLPDFMRLEEVRYYYDILASKKASIRMTRLFDSTVSAVFLIIMSPVFVLLGIAIKMDSPGPVFFRQLRVTQYGKPFYIYKFRTMVMHADQIGSQVTIQNDPRITNVGRQIRKYRVDEIPQLFNVLKGDMSFVGTRPEVPKYVKHYKKAMWATLLLPAGVTSEASIYFKDEDRILDGSEDVDHVYIQAVLPKKMEYNLQSLRKFDFFRNLMIMLKTVLAVIKN